jgi:hypothetical protein
MPIEIRELVIKATVANPQKGTSGQLLTANDYKRLKKEIIEECFDKILDKINDKFDR